MGRKSNLKQSYLLGLIIVLGAFLRLFRLDSLPPSLYWEEAALGYDAFSISQTGRDYHGNFLPIVAFPSFGDFKPSAYFYAAAASIKILGPTDLAVRLPSALAGILAIWLVYLLCRELLLSPGAATLAALFLAISPMSLQFSRAAFEVNLGTTLFLAGILFIFKAREKVWFFSPATLFFALSMYAYHGFRILSPATALTLVLFFQSAFKLRTVLLNLGLALVLVFPIISQIGSPAVSQRFRETSFQAVSQAVTATNQLRAEFGNTLISRIIFHRYWWWAGELASNYLKNFEPNFLYLNGDGNPRHGVGEFGPLYHWQALALLSAIYYCLKDKKTQIKLQPIWFWLLLSPLPVMLTATNPHALRLLPAAPAYAILSAYGLTAWLSSRPKKNIFSLLFGLIIAVEGLVFGHFYYVHYPHLSAREWQSQYREVVSYTEKLKNNYETIYFTKSYGRPSIYVLWYGRYHPADIQAVDGITPKDQQELLAVGKYQFTDNLPPAGGSRALIVTDHELAKSNTQLLKTFYFPDQKPAFYVYDQN